MTSERIAWDSGTGYGPATVSGALRYAWVQLPFFAWLVLLWMLLWGQFTWLALITGLLVAVFVTTVFRLPAAELSGRINPGWLFIFAMQFLAALVGGSLTVAWQVLRPGGARGTAVVAVPLRVDDDLIMTHVGNTCSLIPGSLVLEADRANRVIYLHVIGVRDEADVEHQRASSLRWERRIVRAVGSRAQVEAVKAGVPVVERRAADRRDERGAAAGGGAADPGDERGERGDGS